MSHLRSSNPWLKRITRSRVATHRWEFSMAAQYEEGKHPMQSLTDEKKVTNLKFPPPKGLEWRKLLAALLRC